MLLTLREVFLPSYPTIIDQLYVVDLVVCHIPRIG